MIKTDPRVWDEECFNFDLNSNATVILKADIFVKDSAQRARDRELEEIESTRKAKEEQDRVERAKRELEEAKRELEEIEATRKAKEEQDRVERAKKRELEKMRVKKKTKEHQDQANMIANSITIFVKIDGRRTKTITLYVQLSDTFKNLKDMIQEKEGIPPNEQSLNYFGRPLRDELTLYDYNINNHTYILLNQRPYH